MRHNKMNVAIVGLGYWGPNLLRTFNENKNFKVKYACDVLDRNIDKLKNKYPLVAFTKAYSDLLSDPDIDLICIATPPETHYKLASQALTNGKHVFIEKPMTTSVEDGEKLIMLAEECGKLIFVDHTFVYSSPVKKIRELIANNSLGEPLYFDSERINLGLLQEHINVIWDLAPHDFSILMNIFPDKKPLSLLAIGSKQIHKKVEDMAYIVIRYPDDFVAHVHVSWLSPVKMRQTIIGGKNKMILYDDMSVSEKIKIYECGIDIPFNEETSFKPIYRSGDITVPKLSSDEPLAVEAEHVYQCIIGKETPMVGGREGLEVVRLLEACTTSMRENRTVNLK